MINSDINTAIVEAVSDTFEELGKDRLLSHGTAGLTTSYTFVQQITGLEMQFIFEQILAATVPLVDASDHRIVTAGDSIRTLRCTTCGAGLDTHHDYESFLNLTRDLEAVSELLAAQPRQHTKVDPAAIPEF